MRLRSCDIEKVEELLKLRPLTDKEQASCIDLAQSVITKQRDDIYFNRFERINPETSPEGNLVGLGVAAALGGGSLGVIILGDDNFLRYQIDDPRNRRFVRGGIALTIWTGTFYLCKKLFSMARTEVNKINVLNEQYEKALKIKSLLYRRQ